MTNPPLTSPHLPELNLWHDTLSWQPSPSQQQQFQQLYDQILIGNQTLNLTRITEPSEFWEKHLWDSLRGIQPLPLPASHSLNVIDIGTGAGFPGIPVAIAHPDWSVTLLDSTRKKVAFLEQLVATLALQNAVPLTDRVEALGQQSFHRGAYDLALVRAVAPASVCAEYALPLLKKGGFAVLYRGQWSAEETADLEPVASLLGGTIETVDEFVTPLTQGDRHCILLKKTAKTPGEFPRGVGVPAKYPLS